MTGTLKYLHVTPVGLLAGPKESCTEARRTEILAAPRHVDASRDALLVVCSFVVGALCFFTFFFLPYEQPGGGAADSLYVFSFP